MILGSTLEVFKNVLSSSDQFACNQSPGGLFQKPDYLSLQMCSGSHGNAVQHYDTPPNYIVAKTGYQLCCNT